MRPLGPWSGSTRMGRGGRQLHPPTIARLPNHDYYVPGAWGKGLGFRLYLGVR